MIFVRRLHLSIRLVALLIAALAAPGPLLTAAEAARPLVRVPAGDDQLITAAIESLAATGGIVELEEGIFTIHHPVIIEHDRIELRGQGTKTQLNLAPKANCPVLVIGSRHTPTHRTVIGIVVKDLLIDGNRAEQDFECWGGHCDEQHKTALRNNGITVRGAEKIVIENVTTRRARSGGIVLEKRCRAIGISGLDSYENEFDGLAAYETEDSVFTKLNLHHNRSAGFSFDWRFNNNYISDTSASDNGSQGIFMRDSISNVFEKLVLARNGEQGVFMGETRELPGTACRYNKFRDVIITSNRTQGIRINDASCNPNTLENSLVKDNLLEDISLADFGQLEILAPRLHGEVTSSVAQE